MRNTIIAVVAAASILFTVPSQAAGKSSRQENIGIGSGAVVGALAGGPVGLVIGAALGAKIGDTMHQKNERIDHLQGSVDDSKQTVANLKGNIDTLSSEIERLQNVARPELVSLLQAGIAMDVLFRTDEAILVDVTSDRLAKLAETIVGMPDIHIKLDGFADTRGDADYNLELSERRVEFIRDQFVAAGVDPTRINVSAHGESPAQDESLDSYALERKVSVELFINERQPMASNPN
jgi:outer membrane protein OmpA-like peptidoglycan-associated protein